ncbi:hypothetical protein M9458_049445, partial [Cirrhinus mrigala]
PPGSLIPLALSWSVIDPPPLQDSTPPFLSCPSIPLTLSGSFFLLALPWSSVTTFQVPASATGAVDTALTLWTHGVTLALWLSVSAWPLAPSSPPWPVIPLAQPGSLISSAPPRSLLDPLALSLHPTDSIWLLHFRFGSQSLQLHRAHLGPHLHLSRRSRRLHLDPPDPCCHPGSLALCLRLGSFAPSSSPWPVIPLARPGSLIPPAPPWSLLDSSPSWVSTPPALPCPFIPLDPSGSSCPPPLLWFSVSSETPPPPQLQPLHRRGFNIIRR